jgi:hypothetical protein
MHLITHSTLLRALGWALFNSLWQMGLLWTLYHLSVAFSRKMSASVRHGLALFCLLTGSAWAAISFTMAFIWPWKIAAAGSVAFTVARSALGPLNEFLPYGSALYLLALCFQFIRYGRQFGYARNLQNSGIAKVRPDLRIFAESTARIMGIRKKVTLWLSSKTEIPLTLGYLKPVILLPFAMAANLTTTQMEAIILHELAHIRRNDYLLNLFLILLETLFFFNPFARSFVRTLRNERENCCDDLVIQFRYDPQEYVLALLTLASRSTGKPSLVMAATGEGNRLLLQRARRILRDEGNQRRPGARAFLFLALTLALALVGISRFAGNNGKLTVTKAGITSPAPAALAARHPTSARALPASGHRSENGPGYAADEHVYTISARTMGIRTTSLDPSSARASGPVARKLSQPDRTAGPDERDDAEEGSNSYIEPVTLTTVIKPEDRAFSIGAPSVGLTTPSPSGTTMTEDQPFVPNSSFSFLNVPDTASPVAQLHYLQDLAGRDMENFLVKSVKDLELQLSVYNSLPVSKQSNYRLQKQALEDQIRLQKEYLVKQQQLLKRLHRLGRHKVIVII